MNIKEMLANPSAISGGEAIDKGIKWVRTTGSKFDALVHGLACAIIAHAQSTNDCSRMGALVQAMPKSARRAALIRWATNFSPINVSADPKTGVYRARLRKPDQKNFNQFNLDGARANPYYDWDKSEDNALAALLNASDMNSKVLQIADYFQRKLDDGKVARADVAHVTAKIAAARQVAAVVAG